MIESWVRMTTECADWDRPDASDRRTAACLSMSRLAALGETATAAERGHLAACRLCAARQRAFAGVPLVTRQTGRLVRWVAAAGGLAACLLVGLLIRWPGSRLIVLSSVPEGTAVAEIANVCNVGDANCDGVVDADDLRAFALALYHPTAYAAQYPHCDLVCSNDLNGDCEINDSDLAQLVQCIDG